MWEETRKRIYELKTPQEKLERRERIDRILRTEDKDTGEDALDEPEESLTSPTLACGLFALGCDADACWVGPGIGGPGGIGPLC